MQFIIGYTDYTRQQIVSGAAIGGFGNYDEIVESILYAEEDGWEVKFETSLFRKLFCTAKYRIVAIKP